MDSKIKLILASYGKQNDVRKKAKEEEMLKIPQTADEWIERMQLVVWPMKVEEENSLNLTPEDVGTGSLEDIMSDLAKHAPLDLSVLDEVLKQVEELESKVHFCASKILNIDAMKNEDEDPDKDTRSETPALVRRYRNEEETILENANKSREQEAAAQKAKSVENATYFGFMPNELTPLPRQLEAQQLLNKVTTIQNFPNSFKKVWKKMILSPSSVAVFQDAFWWFFCYNFQKKQQIDKIFSRIAGSFISLFFSVPAAVKDKFFQHYPDCLAQALYAAFCEAFPDSHKLFNDNFKSNLLDTVCEWVWGLTPPPQSWNNSWPLHVLEPAEIRKPQPNSDKLQVNLTFDMDALLNEHVESPSDRSIKPTRSPSRIFPSEIPSHPAGAGPGFVKVNFNIFGQSPLVSHFLAVKGLKKGDIEDAKKTVHRTEISTLPAPKPTYRDLINECKKNSSILAEQYKIVLQMSAEESQRIQKQKREVLARINHMENELTRKQSDLKTLGERIYDTVLHSDYGTS